MASLSAPMFCERRYDLSSTSAVLNLSLPAPYEAEAGYSITRRVRRSIEEFRWWQPLDLNQ